MKRHLTQLAALAACALALGACNTTGYAYHDSIKVQAAGLNMGPSTGFTGGYLAATVDRAANVDKNGNAIKVQGGCKEDAVDTYANLNSKATASATSVAPALLAGATSAGGVTSPSLAWASGDQTANGGAAIIAAAAASAHPADVIAAYCLNNTLPNAPAGTIVRDGTSPSPAAPAK